MKRHDLDPVSLVAGVLFAVVAVVSLLDYADLVSVNGRWVWPVLLIGLGLAGLLTSLRGDGSDDDVSDDDVSDGDVDEVATRR